MVLLNVGIMPTNLRQLIMTNNARKRLLFIRIGGLFGRKFGGTDILSISSMPSTFVEGNQCITI